MLRLVQRMKLFFAIIISLGSASFLIGSFSTALAFGSFFLGVFIPLFAVLSQVFYKQNFDKEFSFILGAVGSFIIIVPIYYIRQFLPISHTFFDILLTLSFYVFLLKERRVNVFIKSLFLKDIFNEMSLSVFIFTTFFACCFLGFAIPIHDGLRYDGLFFVDFGNTLSIANTILTSKGMPEAPVIGTGPLGYHWLYFVVPVWASHFSFFQGKMANSLILTNLLISVLLFRILIRVCRPYVKIEFLSPAFAAATVVFCGSTFYVYQMIFGANGLNFPSSNRNSLVLQLPQSYSAFGNNTLAISMCILIIMLMNDWALKRSKYALVYAGVLTSLLPGYSITLTFSAALMMVIELLRGRITYPVRVLSVFASIGISGLAIFYSIGLFGYGSGGSGLAFCPDNGVFLIRIILGFFPVTISIIYVVMSKKIQMMGAYFSMMLACILIPSFFMTKGTSTSHVDFSMKTASLYLAVSAPMIACSMTWLMTGTKKWLRIICNGIFILGMINSLSYMLKFPLLRMVNSDKVNNVIPWNYYHALEFIQHLDSQLILLDEFSLNYRVCNPAMLVAGKRVLIGSGYERVAFPSSQTSTSNLEIVQAWMKNQHSDDHLSGKIARVSNILISGANPLNSNHWLLLSSFGDVYVYQSKVFER